MATITRRKNAKGKVSFLAQVRIAGFKAAAHTVRVTTTEKDARAQAEEWAEAREKEFKQAKGALRPDVGQLTVAQLIRDYLADDAAKQLKTYTEMQRALDGWVNSHGTMKVLDLNVIVLRAARDKFKHGRSNATVNRRMSALRSAWSWGKAAGLIPAERSWPQRLMLREPKGRVRYLSDEELAELIKAARADSPLMHAAVAVSLATGLRKGELLRLKWSDIDLDAATAIIRESKNGEPRSVHLTSAAVDALGALKKLKVQSPVYPFLAPTKGTPADQNLVEWRWRRIRKAAGLEGTFRWHDMRHSCASILAQNGTRLEEIGSVLGHRSLQTTLRYAHLIQGKALPGHAALDAMLKGKASA